ncbi:MAG: hypothetical protein QOE27_1557 [Solirubrobacteraceae bacterium]|nr:hypothetical protein [Solirubrobacteraceae bacterium]
MPARGEDEASTVGALIDRLGLTDDEVLAVFEVDSLALISGDLAHRPELAILASLTAEAADQIGEPLLRRWLRAAGPGGRPISLLLDGDFAGFEDALATLLERGLILGGGDPPAGRPTGVEDRTAGL